MHSPVPAHVPRGRRGYGGCRCRQWMARLDDDIQVATAWGPGSGRFLAQALVDALQSDHDLIAVKESGSPPAGGARGVDFVFARAGAERDEIIRVGLDGDGRVVSAQLLRCASGQHGTTGPAAGELLEALRAGPSISALHWVPAGASPRGMLAITVSFDRQFRIAPGG